jgi:hypothetical protein
VNESLRKASLVLDIRSDTVRECDTVQNTFKQLTIVTREL